MFDLVLSSVAVVSKESEHHQDVTDGDGSVVVHVPMAVFGDTCLGYRVPNGACAAAASVFARRSCLWKKQHGVDDVHHSVVSNDVGYNDLRIVDENAAIAINGYCHFSSVEGGDGLSVAEVSAERGSSYDVVEENLGELGQREQVFCRGAEGSGEREEGVVGRSEDGERTFAAQCAGEVCGDDRCFEEVVHVAVDDDVDDGVGGLRCWRKQHGIDDVHHPVVGDDVGHDDLCVVDEDTCFVDGHGHLGSVEGGDGLSVAEVSAERGSSYDVVEENLGELGQREQVFCRGAEGSGEREEGVVGRSEDGERTFAAQCAGEVCGDDRCFEEVVHVAVDDDVDDGVGGLRCWRKQHGIDDVHHPVVGDDVGHDDLCVVDEDTCFVDGHGHLGSVEGGDGLSVAEVSAERGSAYDVVEEDVGELGQREQVFCRGAEGTSEREEGVVGRSEDSEWPFSAECSSKVRRDDGGFEQVVDVAVDDDVDNGVRGGFISQDSDGTGVACRGRVVVVRSRNFEVDGANARTKEPKTVRRRQGEILGVVEGFTRVDVGHAVHIVNATKCDEFDAFAGVDGQMVG